ncbi:MAG TPA: septal ring lytic transglycosylase RlpA family protein [Thermodesulfobacteriota bacterium]|nr:septal ring lytic transglycosylase RlpA family protein [Thermodesulfobacteriota bacterium]
MPLFYSSPISHPDCYNLFQLLWVLAGSCSYPFRISYSFFSNANYDYYTIGIASWYGDYFHGKTTASGEPFNMYDYTAAHRKLPLGTKVRVVNLENGEDVTVDINDRGPYIDGRTIDLSYAAAKSIWIVDSGISEVKIEIVSKPNT